MTTQDIAARSDRSNGLRVFQTPEGRCYVESSEGKICYRVSGGDGSWTCTCGDYTSMIAKDQHFVCKHILAVMHAAGRKLACIPHPTPRLDERFITTIKAKEFVLYSGLLDLAHQRGIRSITVEPVQYPTRENRMEAICRAAVESKEGEIFVEIADANPVNVNRMVAEHILRVAATRAKARALRDFTNIGMTCLEELGDLDELVDDDSGTQKARSRRTVMKRVQTINNDRQKGTTADEERANHTEREGRRPSTESGAGAAAESAKDTQAPDTAEEEIRPSEAQIKAIQKLAERRGITEERLLKMFADKYHKPYGQINAGEAKGFIRHLQQAA